jgi:hypothetical protein
MRNFARGDGAIERREFEPARWVGGCHRANNNGAWGWNRTSDTRIFSPLLYQLSYPGAP